MFDWFLPYMDMAAIYEYELLSVLVLYDEIFLY